MKKKIVIVIACLILSAFILCACGENYKTNAIATDMSDLSVSSNGGLAVRVGKYLYYINGYAANTEPNNFGEVEKGAIARVELDDNGAPIWSTNQIIIKKMAYSTSKTSGLYVVGEYIYYSSPSVVKNKNGEPKNTEMALIRTKLDGTDTKIVAEFGDFTSATYKIVNGYVLYVKENELHEINLNSKKFDDKVVTDEVSSFYMPEYKDGQNDFVNGVFFIKASEVVGQTNNNIWYYRAGGEAKKVIEGNVNSYPAERLEHPSGYTFALVESIYSGDNLKLFYTKTDSSGELKSSAGTYSYEFNSELNFNYQNEVRYNVNSANNYTQFRKLDDNTMLAMLNSNLVMITKTATGWSSPIKVMETTINEILDVQIVESSVVVYYLNSSSVIQKMTVMAINDDGTYDPDKKEAAEKLSSVAYDSTWFTFDRVGNIHYFFNSNVGKYTYYINIFDINPEIESSATPKLLSIITEADKIALLG